MATERLDPVGDTADSDWVGTYTDINDGSDVTDTQPSGSAFPFDVYNIEATDLSSGQTINSLACFVRMYSDTASDDARIYIRRNFSYAFGASLNNLGTEVAEHSFAYLTDPDDSQPWESAQIDEMNSGNGDAMGVQDNTSSADIHLTQMWGIVDYVGAAVGGIVTSLNHRKIMKNLLTR